MLRHRVLDERHAYRSVSLDMPLMARTEALPSDAWRASPSIESLPFGQVQSPQQVAPWHSPSAQNLMVPVGDLALLRHCEATGDYGQLRTAWVGSLFEVAHRMVIQMPTSRPPSSWGWAT